MLATYILSITLVPLILLSLPASISSQDNCNASDSPVVVCYYASWAVYRPGNGTFKLDYINPQLCTHVIYSFAGLNLHGAIDSLDYNNDVTMGE